MMEWLTLKVMRTLFRDEKIISYHDSDPSPFKTNLLVFDTFLDDDWVLLRVRKFSSIIQIERNFLSSREGGRSEFQSKDCHLID